MKNKSVDLVYVVGTGSQWNDNELRFSLRSVEKNLSGTGRIFIVGHLPDFVKGIVLIPAKDIFEPVKNADGNMIHKLLIACNDKRLSNNFLFMNDDFIINRPNSAAAVPTFHKGDMALQPDSYWQTQFYRFRLKRTFDVLKERGLPTIQYDYHAPMLMNKKLFIDIMAGFDYAKDIGYTFRSIYGNSLKLHALPVIGQKITIFKYFKLDEIKFKTMDINFVGYNDQGLNQSLKYWLIEQFPEKCKYENTEPQDRITDTFLWFKNGMQYREGVTIFKKYYKHKNLIHMFESMESDKLKAKLKYKLSQSISDL